jgi:hypothetical protein
VERVARRLARIAVHPRAAVDDDHDGSGPIDLLRTVVIVAQREPVDLGVHDVHSERVVLGFSGNVRDLAGERHAFE